MQAEDRGLGNKELVRGRVNELLIKASRVVFPPETSNDAILILQGGADQSVSTDPIEYTALALVDNLL